MVLKWRCCSAAFQRSWNDLVRPKCLVRSSCCIIQVIEKFIITRWTPPPARQPHLFTWPELNFHTILALRGLLKRDLRRWERTFTLSPFPTAWCPELRRGSCRRRVYRCWKGNIRRRVFNSSIFQGVRLFFFFFSIYLCCTLQHPKRWPERFTQTR